MPPDPRAPPVLVAPVGAQSPDAIGARLLNRSAPFGRMRRGVDAKGEVAGQLPLRQPDQRIGSGHRLETTGRYDHLAQRVDVAAESRHVAPANVIR